MKISSFIKSIDFLGPEMKFRINKQENFKTVFGGFISILYYIAFLSFFILFGGDFFKKRNPKIVSQTLIDTTFNKTIKLSKDNFFLAFILRDGINRPIDNLNFNKTNFNFSYTIVKEKKLKSIDIPIKKCSEADFNLFNILKNKSEFFCADFSAMKNQLEIGGGYETIDFFFALLSLNIKINQDLFNDFKDKNNATQTKAYLDLIQNVVSIQVVVPSTIFDPNNYQTPLKYEAKYLISALSFESYLLDEVFLSDYVVETDSGIFFDNVESTNMTGFGKKENILLRYNETDAVAHYEMNLTYEQAYFLSTRQYMKFQDLLGNIMGFMDMIVFVLSFLISFNSDYRLNKYIANKLVYIVDKDFCNGDIYNNKESSSRVKKEIESSVKIKDEIIDDSKSCNRFVKFKNENNYPKREKLLFFSNNNIELANANNDLSQSEKKDVFKDQSINSVNSIKNLLPQENKEKKLNEESLKFRIDLANEIYKRKNTSKRDLEYSLTDHLFKGKVCKYRNNFDKNRSNREFAEEITEKAFKKFDIFYYLRFLNEFENIKKVILDEFQMKILVDVSKRLYFYTHSKKDELLEPVNNKKIMKDVEAINKYFVEKFMMEKMSKKDKRLLEFFDVII